MDFLIFQAPILMVQASMDGILLGILFALIAYGMALQWGVMNIINIAQGELVIMGGYIAYFMYLSGIHPAFGVIVSPIIMYCVGWGMYKLVINKVVDKDLFTSILATFGISILAQQLMNFAFGADVVVEATHENLGDAIKAANGGKRVNLILEMVGGKTFDDSLEILAPFGRLVTYGMASRVAPTMIQPASLMGGSKTITGFWLSHCFGKKELMNDVIEQLFALVVEGKLKPVIGATYPLSEASKAHKAMLSRETTGKITLNPAL